MIDQDAVFAATFFDEPGLLAVRFARAGASRVADFAVYRHHDVAPAGWGLGAAGVVGVGLVLACVGATLLGHVGSSSFAGPATITVGTAFTGDDGTSSTPGDGAGPGGDWTVGLSDLADDLAPARADLQPWAVRTLLDVPREQQRHGDATGGWLAPRASAEGQAAFQRGQQLTALLDAAGSGADLGVILDLPGPLGVAAAAGMASRFEPVFTMDNLPHPAAVVPSAETLAAVVFWRSTFMLARGSRPQPAAALFVLEGARLAPYRNEVERFDNRSRARLPEAADFKALGIGRVLYVRQHRGEVGEADDLNALFVSLADAGIEVKHLALETMDAVAAEAPPGQPVPVATATATGIDTSTAPAMSGHSAWFWSNYGWYRPSGYYWPDLYDVDARYRCRPRTTLFSTYVQPGAYDGGQRYHAIALDRMRLAGHPSGWSSGTFSTTPHSTSSHLSFPSFSSSPTPTSSSSGGGSWARSFGSSSG